jgi:hypothetical protein
MTSLEVQSIPDVRRRYGAYVANLNSGTFAQRYIIEIFLLVLGLLLGIGGMILFHGAPGASGIGIALMAIAVSSVISRQKTAKGRSNLAQTGVPVWSVLVQANDLLFQPGGYPLPCQVIFSFESVGSHLEYMQRLAGDVFDLKGTQQTDPNLRLVAKLVTDERSVKYRRSKLPVSFTGGPTVYCADLVVVRKCLLNGFLTERELFCIAEPGENGALELLPWQIAAGEDPDLP